MTISRSPELQRAKAILGNSTLASGARERIYWRIVHKPARVGRGRWRLSVMVFGWLTAASAAYGLGRIVYSTLPVLGKESAAMSAAQQPTGEATRHRSKGHGRAAETGSNRSAAPVGSASPRTAAIPPATHTTPIATATTATTATTAATATTATTSGAISTGRLPVTTEPHATTRGSEVAIATLAPAATSGPSAPDVALARSAPTTVPGQPTTDIAPDQESPKLLTGPMRAREDAPGSDGVSELSLQVADYKRAVALLNTQPEAALERLYAHRRQWPSSAIAQEVDLRIIQSLLVLQRTDSARAAARSFLLHYPGSARTQEVSRIANANH